MASSANIPSYGILKTLQCQIYNKILILVLDLGETSHEMPSSCETVWSIFFLTNIVESLLFHKLAIFLSIRSVRINTIVSGFDFVSFLGAQVVSHVALKGFRVLLCFVVWKDKNVFVFWRSSNILESELQHVAFQLIRPHSKAR